MNEDVMNLLSKGKVAEFGLFLVVCEQRELTEMSAHTPFPIWQKLPLNLC